MSTLHPQEFRISRADGDGEVVVAVHGEVDMSTAPQLLEAVGAALDGAGHVVIDATKMTFIDSQGIKVLVEAHKRAQPGGTGRLVIRSPQPHVRKVLEITGLDTRLTIEG